MSALVASPVEILTQIFQECSSFTDVISLSSTCRRLNSAWLSGQDQIIWSIGMRSMHAFNDALMAVRATEIILPAFEAGLLPPDIGSLKSLSGAAKKPSLTELKKIRDIQHLAQCLEHMYFCWNPKPVDGANRGSDWYNNGVILDGNPMFYEFWDETPPNEWRERFYRATYRLFLAGAAFCRAYNEPFFLHPKFGTNNVDWDAIVQEDFEYFKTFPVYNLDVEDDVGQGTVFHAMSRWIVQDTRLKALKDDFVADIDGPEWLISAESEQKLKDPDIFGVWEILCMVLAYEHMQAKFISDDTNHPTVGHTHTPLAIPGRTRTARVAIFGVFQPEEIFMPSCAQDTKDIFLVAKHLPKPTEPNDTSAFSWNIPRVLRYQYGELLESVSERAVPPSLLFITYTLRKYFSLQFPDTMFDTTWEEAGYYDFLRESNLFEEQENNSCGIGYVEMI